jgi:hypothetical protein
MWTSVSPWVAGVPVAAIDHKHLHRIIGRGLHSSTSLLNLSCFCH